MSQRPTRDDVAKEAGVSAATVSYVLNERTDVSIPESTRSRVLQAAQELKYQPNRLARALRTGHTRIVMLWASSLGSAYSAAIVHHLYEQLALSGYEMMIADPRQLPEQKLQLARLAEWPLAGVVALAYPGYYIDAFVEMTSEARPPLVSIGYPCSDKIDHVQLRLYSGAHKAMEHLISSGCQRLAYASHPEGVREGTPRKEAYETVMQRVGLRPEYIHIPSPSRQLAWEATLCFVETNGHPDGIFCFNDDVAMGVLRALHDLDLAVPDDVALVGYDGIEESAYIEPPLSTVALPIPRMCELAWQFLQRRMEDPTIALQQTTLEPQLVVRKSSLRRWRYDEN